MKKIIIIAFAFFACYSCSNNKRIVSLEKAVSLSNNPNKVEFFYLPWDMTTQGNVSISEIMDFNYGKNSYYSISDTTVTNKLLGLVSHLEPFEGVSEFNYRMLILFHFPNDNILQVGLNNKRLVKINNQVFHRNYELTLYIDSVIPVAKYE